MFLYSKFNRPIQIPSSPCGNPDHSTWVNSGWPCPVCTAQENKSQKQIDEDRLVKRIAAEVVKQLKDNGLTIPQKKV
jgi:hypothetical protein